MKVILLLTALFSVTWAHSMSLNDSTTVAVFDEEEPNSSYVKSKINIITKNPIALHQGFAGFNMRIGDTPWTYNNPVFRKGVQQANPGFLRYFSGTRNDYLDFNTGLYIEEHHEQIKSANKEDGDDGWKEKVPNDIKWVNGKIPNRLSDMYDLCGSVGSRLIITLNPFVQSPEEVKTFIKFIKDNNILVEAYQLANEPQLYRKPKGKYFFKNGEDFAYKVDEIIKAVREIDPDARIAHNYAFDNISSGKWAEGIKKYHKENGRNWDYVSMHSYLFFGTGNKDYDKELERIRTRIRKFTSDDFFDGRFTKTSWEDSKLIITEFSLWNKTVRYTHAYGNLFNPEYLMRMSVQPRAYMIGNHYMGEAIRAKNKYKNKIFEAYNNHEHFDPSNLPNSYTAREEKVALGHIYGVLNNSDQSYITKISGSAKVSAQEEEVDALYAVGYRGNERVDYLMVVNTSDKGHKVQVKLDGTLINKKLAIKYSYGETPQGEILHGEENAISSEKVTIRPYSVTIISWPKDQLPTPKPTRIYSIRHEKNAATLKWWKRNTADEYIIKYGTSKNNLNQTVKVKGVATKTINGLDHSKEYFFSVVAKNQSGSSESSNIVNTKVNKPDAPKLVRSYKYDGKVIVHWESVPFANGYKVQYKTENGDFSEEVEAKNITGYVIEKLKNNIEYEISVTAYNGNGNSQSSNVFNVTPSENIPWTPYWLRVSNEKGEGVKLKWQPSDNNRGGKYSVYYCPSPWDESSYELVAEGLTSPEFIDTKERSGNRWYYRVKSVTEDGASNFYSNIATFTTKKKNTK
ncbi:fibronectin type III domain-containing protein [Flammeovirga sp. SubArs3]|uniref:fibronectin type III domain-containing protein n=1 Tax=Flammeovirga sp. SubArs3 TaxID=2995316 RepID=UPI00248C2AEA|nr:fibronectin type III domain-containing protein [Flammeovirga sp. SubArs3]